jgi:Ca2+-binding RTX toxin-like protein
MRRTILLLATTALTLLVASGVALAVTKIGTDGPDTLRGTNGADTLIGKGGNDVLFALRGNDTLLGGPGKDIVWGGKACCGGSLSDYSGGDKNLLGGDGNEVVVGGKGSDNILGEEGNDLLSSGPPGESSANRLFAGDGNDVILVRQPGAKDIVTCGGGFDRVFAERIDVVASDCERVADRLSEYVALGDSIPDSFWEGLPPKFHF